MSKQVVQLECSSKVVELEDGSYAIVLTMTGFPSRDEAAGVSEALAEPFSCALTVAIELHHGEGRPERGLHS